MISSSRLDWLSGEWPGLLQELLWVGDLGRCAGQVSAEAGGASVSCTGYLTFGP
jgi:hypothetical protein